ncbi:MAG TPA: hypothetical protein DCZ03_02880 [Gammaproteobacteria bacterium]|nr:hypothetical protein [Gammaproteobacteria bacterium]
MNLIVGSGSVGSVLACFLSGMGHPLSWVVPKSQFSELNTTVPLQVTFPHGYQLIKSTPKLTTEIDLRGVHKVLLAQDFSNTKRTLDELPLDFYSRLTVMPCVSSLEEGNELCRRYAPAKIQPLVVMFDAVRKNTKEVQLITRPRIMSHRLSPDISSAFYLMGMGVHQTDPSVYWGNVLLHSADPLAALTGLSYRDLLLHPVLRDLSLKLFTETIETLTPLKIPLIFPDGGRINFALLNNMVKHMPHFSWHLIKNILGTYDEAKPVLCEKLRQGNSHRAHAINGAVVRLAQNLDRETRYHQKVLELCDQFAHEKAMSRFSIERLQNHLLGGCFLA